MGADIETYRLGGSETYSFVLYFNGVSVKGHITESTTVER